MDIRKTVVAAVAALPLFASFAALEVVSPQEGETVEQLWPAEKAFLDMPRESRATYHDAEHTEEWKRLKRCKAWLAEHENDAAADILSDAMAAYAMR